MIVTTTGFIQRLDFSEKFANFTKHHHTFGKNTKIYNADSTQFLDFEVVTLQRKDDEGKLVSAAIVEDSLNDIFNIVNWLFVECDGGVLTSNVDTVNNELATRFGSSTLAVVADKMLADAANKILPNKITLTYTVGEDKYNFEFWFNSLSIEDEYTGSDIVVFGSTEQVDQLINDKSTVLDLINQRGIKEYNEIINQANREAPYTGVTTMDTVWVNKDNPAETMQIRFNFICYGPVLDNVSLLRIALHKYVVDNSAMPDSVWEVVLPEIFTATTFLMVPGWERVSNGVGESSIYNPIMATNQIANVFKNHLSGYTEAHVNETFEVLPCMWQSLAIGVCGAPNNKVELNSLSLSLGDYMLVAVDTPNFIRLSDSTKDFVLKLHNALPYVQKYVPGMALPGTLDHEVIDGYNFIIFNSYNVRCKIMAKQDYLALIGA